MKGDRVEAVVDTGQGWVQTFEVVATRASPLDVDHLDQPFLQRGCGFDHRHRTDGWGVKVVLH